MFIPPDRKAKLFSMANMLFHANFLVKGLPYPTYDGATKSERSSIIHL